jgi:hypothetical protein
MSAHPILFPNELLASLGLGVLLANLGLSDFLLATPSVSKYKMF